MACVRSASYSILINGSLEGFFHGAKGLLQGDLLSSFLFVIVMEYLSRSFAPPLSYFRFHGDCVQLKMVHLSFVDDLFIFSKTDQASISWIKTVMDHFHLVSDLTVNTDKSFVYSQNSAMDLSGLVGIMGFSDRLPPSQIPGPSSYSIQAAQIPLFEYSRKD